MDKVKITQKELDDIYDVIPDIEEKEKKEDGKEVETVISFEDFTEKKDEEEVLEY